MIQKIVGNRTEFECPDCTIVQELYLFEGKFYLGKTRWSEEEHCNIAVPQWRRVYICMQCAAEAESGFFLQVKPLRRPPTRKGRTP